MATLTYPRPPTPNQRHQQLNHEQVAFQRRYISYIKRCDELERKLRYIRGEISKFGLETEVPGGFQQFLAQSQGDAKEQRSGAYVLEQLETKLEDMEGRLLELNSFGEKITREYNEKVGGGCVLCVVWGYCVRTIRTSRQPSRHIEPTLVSTPSKKQVEFQEVLQKVQRLFATDGAAIMREEQAQTAAHSRDKSIDSAASHDNARPLLNAETGQSGPAVDKDMRFSFLAGVVNEEDRGRFERMLFRATKGNVYTRFAEIDLPIVDPVTQELTKKVGGFRAGWLGWRRRRIMKEASKCTLSYLTCRPHPNRTNTKHRTCSSSSTSRRPSSGRSPRSATPSPPGATLSRTWTMRRGSRRCWRTPTRSCWTLAWCCRRTRTRSSRCARTWPRSGSTGCGRW